MMSYEELYAVYEHSVKHQKTVIARYRKKLNEAMHADRRAEVQRLNKLLRVLYEEKSELEERAKGLRDYLS